MVDWIARILVLITAIVQIAFPFFVNPFRDGQQPFRGSEPSQIEPTGYAFAIWEPIYFLALGYAIWQLLPAGRADPVTLRIAPLAATTYMGSSLWLTAAKVGPYWATMPILALMAVCACVALVLALEGARRDRPKWWLAVLPFGLYAGWTVCAFFVNVAEVAPAYGFNRFGLSVAQYAAGSIAILTGVVALLLVVTRGNIPFAASVLWALAGILAATRVRGAEFIVTAAAAIAIVAVIALTSLTRLSEPSG
jgi:hypothetical protein